MDPVALFAAVGFLGGLVIACCFALLRRRLQARASPDIFRAGRLSTDVINMANIRVAGIGGLGLVAMALTVALNVPRIGQSVAIGLVLGVVLAVTLIILRQRRGPMPSSGRHSGATAVLAIDDRPSTVDEPDQNSSDVRPRVGSDLPTAAPHIV
jgi:hypothetical protein